VPQLFNALDLLQLISSMLEPACWLRNRGDSLYRHCRWLDNSSIDVFTRSAFSLSRFGVCNGACNLLATRVRALRAVLLNHW
jgi:hypothetical protein